MCTNLKAWQTIGIGLCSLLLAVASAEAAESQVTAIDILLKPDSTMIQQAQSANTKLRNNFPKGFALDVSHQPHITLLQRYVNTADLDKVYAAASKVLASEKPTRWKLKAFKYYYIPVGQTGLAGIVVKPTRNLIHLQEKLIDAVAPFTVATGTAAAFATTPAEPDINQATMDYVGAYIAKQKGEKYNPHVTIGIGHTDYLDKLQAEPFEQFSFAPAGASVYQLGNFGTAQKELKALKLKP